MKEYNLKRFEEMENSFRSAMAELKNGRKTGCWMWWIFPQIRGLGSSYESTYYGIGDLDEAKAYLENDTLRKRLQALCGILLELKENDPQITAQRIMGTVDAMKLRSSMTLFAEAAGENSIYETVLDRYWGGDRDGNTLDILYPKKK